MAAVSWKELFWICLDPSRYVPLLQEQADLKTLAELCVKKLIDDIDLIKAYLPRLPSSIYAILLASAIDQKKKFAVVELVRGCPDEKMQLPLRGVLKSHHMLFDPDVKLNEAHIYFDALVDIMISTFLNIIEDNHNGKNTASKLYHLDINILPVDVKVFTHIKGFLQRIKHRLSKEYTFRCSVFIQNCPDLLLLTSCIEAADAIGLKIIITGLSVFNNHYPDISLMYALEKMSALDVELVSLSYTTVLPSLEPILESLRSFKLVKYLNMSYLAIKIDGMILDLFAAAFAEFSVLERLVLTGTDLDNVLSKLLSGYCKKDCGGKKIKTDSNCCIAHNGTLEYLDVSYCNMRGTEIDILRELTPKKSLKYLDISSNYLDAESVFETLLSLKSSLTVIEMNNCGVQGEYNSKTFPLSEFQKLVSLSMLGIERSEEGSKMMKVETSKMPRLHTIVS